MSFGAGLTGNMLASQSNSMFGSPGIANYPISQGSVEMTFPTGGIARFLQNGSGTFQAGPLGIGGSISRLPGDAITAANTSNTLGLASPFATLSAFLSNIAFGAVNPFSPIIGTPFDIPQGIAQALGSFGGLYDNGFVNRNIFPAGGLGSGPPVGSVPSGFPLGSMQQPWNGGVAQNPFGFGQMPTGFGQSPIYNPYYGGAAQGYGQFNPYTQSPAGYGQPAYNPYYGGVAQGFGQPNPYGMYPGSQGLNAFPQISPNAIQGFAQSLSHIADGSGGRFNQFSDGVSKLFGQVLADPRMPRSLYGASGYLQNALGTFEYGIGARGGNANAGYLGAQAAGDAFAIVRSPTGAIVSYANPVYDRTNWAQNSTFMV